MSLMRYVTFKFMVFPHICIVVGRPCPPQTLPTTIQNVCENHAISCDMYMQSILNYRRPSYPIDAIMIRLLGAIIVLMHEIIRIMNMFHWNSLYSKVKTPYAFKVSLCLEKPFQKLYTHNCSGDRDDHSYEFPGQLILYAYMVEQIMIDCGFEYFFVQLLLWWYTQNFWSEKA